MKTETRYILSTDEFARLNGIKSESVRTHLCRTGAYFGIKPKKLINRRLMWPAVQVTAAQGGEA